ncbi:MAG: nickel pincer cofactor biosynthesis protein LarB [Candidatus Ranarchaeia archaeon]|jgi:NCAIR mutase (PurE)-related protein
MNIREILQHLQKGEISLEEAEKQLQLLSIEEIGNLARIDLHRDFRSGIPEIIYGFSKTPQEVVTILQTLVNKKPILIASRLTPKHLLAIKNNLEKKEITLVINEQAKTAVVSKKNYAISPSGGKVGIIAAGTSDIPVAEEVRVVAEAMGCEVKSTVDIGVAGLHRLFPQLKQMIEWSMDVLVVVAGMEGALPSVVTGLVDVPVIGVPTSTGYGHGGKGEGALTTMLQSCALGLTVVNIDNGIGAGAFAALVANNMAKERKK